MYQLFALIQKKSDFPGIFFWNTWYKRHRRSKFILYVLCASL